MILGLFKVVVKDKISTKKSCRCLFLYLVYIQSTCLEEYLFSLKKRDEQIFRWFWGFLKSQLKTKYKEKLQMSVFISCLHSQYLYWRVFFSLKISDEQIFRWFWGFLKSQLKTKYKKKVAVVCFYILFTLKVFVMKSIFFPVLWNNNFFMNVMSRFLNDSGALLSRSKRQNIRKNNYRWLFHILFTFNVSVLKSILLLSFWTIIFSWTRYFPWRSSFCPKII